MVDGNHQASNIRILRRPVVESTVGLSRSTIYQLISEGLFPSPINLGARAVGWLESDIHKWLQNKLDAARANPSSGVQR